MFGRGVFLKGKNFHSIMIVVPLHGSKFYRVLKKLMAYPEGVQPAPAVSRTSLRQRSLQLSCKILPRSLEQAAGFLNRVRGDAAQEKKWSCWGTHFRALGIECLRS
jgi:hypothetical protein